MKMSLIDVRKVGKKYNKYGGRNEIVSVQNGVTGLFCRLRVNTLRQKRFLYRVHESDMGKN